MQVPLLDLKGQYAQIREEVLDAAREVFETQYFILGPQVEKLEKEIAEYCQAPHAVGVSSGTDALLIALMTADVQADDLVVTTPYSFFATAGSIVRAGAQPVFVDIESSTYNLDPDSLQQTLETMPPAQRDRLKALIPVHLYGQCADMDALMDIARRYHLVVIEDAAQAIGSEYRQRRAGSFGDYGCFSFFPSKNLGAFGDGGIVTLQSEELYEKMKILRVHGSRPKYYHRLIGGNFRLDALQAAIVSIKLKHLDGWTAGRRQNAQNYRRLFEEAGLDTVRLPEEKGNRHIYNQFVIAVADRRDELRQHLQAAGVGTEIYYPVPLHLQECFGYLGYRKGDLPNAEQAADTTLALPIYPELTPDQQAYVVDCIKSFYQG